MSSSSPSSPTVRKGSGGRPTREASEALADSILDTAWRLFLQNGYKKLSVDSIALTASVSKRTIYDRFGSKEGLFEALVVRASERWGQQATSVYAAARMGNWLEPLVAHLLDLLRSEDYVALISFMQTDGHAFPQIVERQRLAGEQSLSALAAHFAPRMETYPKGQAGRLMAFTILAHISGSAGLFPQGVPGLSETALKKRVYREVRALLDFYGCGPLVAETATAKA